MSTRNARSAGLGSLLSTPTPPADQDPEYAAHQAKKQGAAKPKATRAPKAARVAKEDLMWLATDTDSYEEIARVKAPDEKGAIAKVQEETGRRGKFAVSLLDPETDGPDLLPARRTSRTTGALAHRGAPAVLPRKRGQRIAKDKLTCQVPVSVLDGLDALVERDDTRKYDEVEEALRAHLKGKGIELDED
jgi:hypothetical protein